MYSSIKSWSPKLPNSLGPASIKILFTFKVSEKYKNIEAQKIEHTIHQFLKENKNLHIINEWFKLTNDMVVQIAKCLIDNFT